MTRLDQLSQPRARKAGAAAEQRQPSKGLNETGVDMSKSMTHLAAAASGGGGGSVAGEKRLKRGAATSKSMVHLGPPRMTRAERLRKLARDGNATGPTPTSAKPQATSPSGKIDRRSLLQTILLSSGKGVTFFSLKTRITY